MSVIFDANLPAVKDGYLWKQSEHVKKWNKRYFILVTAPSSSGARRGLTPAARTSTGRPVRRSHRRLFFFIYLC